MSRPNKLQRYAENTASEMVVESSKPIYEEIAGRWGEKFFKNNHPITVEMACGKGEYTVGLAEKFPERNFIGIDLKGDRIWVGRNLAEQKGLKNVGFVRSRIELIPEFFGPGEVDEIWLTFPDPRPKDRDEKHRLTNLAYLNLYRTILAADGWFRFKTDNTPLFDYTIEVLHNVPHHSRAETYDLYRSDLLDDHHGLKTKYEGIWTAKGESIKYLKCKFG